jgi:hypothetical protein
MSQLSTKHAPFHMLSPAAALLKIIHDQRPPRPTDGDAFRLQLITDALWDMVQKCWAPDAAERPTAAHIVSELAATTSRVIAEDEENSSLVLLRPRHQPGIEPDDEPARKRSLMLQLEAPFGQQPHRSLGVAVTVASPSTVSGGPQNVTLPGFSMFEEFPHLPAEARVRHQPGLEPDDKPARKRSRMLQLEVPSGREPHRSLGVAVTVVSPSTAIGGPKIGTIPVSSAFEASWLARTEARVRHFYWDSCAGFVSLCLWHR